MPERIDLGFLAFIFVSALAVIVSLLTMDYVRDHLREKRAVKKLERAIAAREAAERSHFITPNELRISNSYGKKHVSYQGRSASHRRPRGRVKK